MGVHSMRPVARPKRRGLLIVGILCLQLLLMGAAFVGGRLIGSQNQRGSRQNGLSRLSAQLPNGPAAGSGTVQKIQDNVITLAARGGFGGNRGGQGNAGTTAETEVTVTPETKLYSGGFSGGPGGPGGQGGGASQAELAEIKLTDIKVGNTMMVWGTKNGQRIAADVVYVQSFGN